MGIFPISPHLNTFIFRVARSFALALIVLCFPYQDGNAQNHSLKVVVDSVLSLSAPDSFKVKTFNQISASYYYKDPDISIKLSQHALALGQKTGCKNGEVDALRSIAIAYSLKSDYTTSESLYHKVLDLAIKYQYTKAVGSVYNGLAIVSKNQGKFYQSLQYNLKALEVRKSIQDTYGTANTLANIALLYKSINDYNQAEKYMLQAIPLFEQLGDQAQKAHSLQTLASIYIKKGFFSKADTLLNQSVLLYEKTGNKSGLGHCYLDLSEVKYQSDSLTVAIEYAQKALLFGREIKSKSLEAYSNRNLAEYYLAMGQKTIAYQYAKAALDTALKIKNYQIISSSLLTMSKIAESLGQDKNSLDCLKKYIIFQDSVKEVDHKQVIYFLNEKYESQIQEAKNQADLVKSRTTFKYLSIILSIVLCFSFAIILLYSISVKKLRVSRSKLKAALEKIEAQAHELATLNSELADKVKLQTRHLEQAIEKLRKHAYLNSHDVRRPLANILGLVSLLDREDLSNPENNRLLDLIEQSALQLDEVIHKINEVVDTH